MRRTKSCIDVNRGTWTPAEDLLLKTHIQIHGEGHWNSIPSKSGLQRTGKSCRLRWMNYLRPSVKRGHISADEEELIIRLHKLLGNRWSLIAGRMPGRTDSKIKNYWNTHLSKKVVRKDPKCTKQGYTYNVCAVTDVQHLSDQNEKVSSESEREREKTMMDNTIDINDLMGDYSVCNLNDQTGFSYEEIERDEDIQWNISSNWESATYQLSGYEDALLQDFSMGMEKISYVNNDTNNMYHFESLPNSSLLLSRFINPHNFCCSSPFNITSDEARFPYTAEEISANPQTQTEISTLFF